MYFSHMDFLFCYRATVEFLFMSAGLTYTGSEFATALKRLGTGHEAWDTPTGHVITHGPGNGYSEYRYLYIYICTILCEWS